MCKPIDFTEYQNHNSIWTFNVTFNLLVNV